MLLMMERISSLRGWKRAGLIVGATIVALATLAVDQHTLANRPTTIATNGTNESRRRHYPRTPPPRTMFVFLAGLEGTGHHLYETLYNKHSQKLLDIFQDKNGEMMTLRDDLTKLQFSLYNDRAPEKALFTGHLGYLKRRVHVNGNAIFDSIVRQLNTTNQKVSSWLDRHDSKDDTPWRTGPSYDTTNTTFPIPLNGLSGRGYGMMSYPNYLVPLRPLQYPDLHLLYRACDAAHVTCGHVYLHRNPVAIIESTVSKRHFGVEDDQIVLYTTMAAVLRAQLIDHRDRAIACLDYDHLSVSSSSTSASHNNDQTTDLDRFLHLFGIEPTAFQNAYQPPNATTNSNFTVSPYLQIYMDSFVETSRTTWETCTVTARESGWFAQ